MENSLVNHAEPIRKTPMQPAIIIADDHSMIRKGLKLHIQLNLGFTNIEEVASCHELMRELQPAEIYGEALKQYGIHYYLSKTVGDEEIVQVLQKFLQNETLLKKTNTPHPDNPFSSLAPRELEILHYLLKGAGTKEIADSLNLKMNTVSTIKTRIYEKTNAGNMKELMELATLYNVNY